MTLTRRDFLGHAARGSGLVCLPPFVAGCGVMEAAEPRVTVPDNPFLAWFGIDSASISRVMAKLTANGADAADLYFQHRRAIALSLDDGVIGPPQSEIDQGVGLRVVNGDETGFAFTDELTLSSMLAAARIAGEAANGTVPAAPRQYRSRATPDLYHTSVSWTDISDERKLALLERVDRAARTADPSIRNVTVSWSDSDERILIATADGFLVDDQRPLTRLSVQVTAARNGATHSGYASISARAGMDWYDEQRIGDLVQQAVDRTLILFEAHQPPFGDLPVILAAGSSGILLHEAIGHGLEADLNRQGRSPWAGMTGERVAAAGIAIVDDGTVPNARGALNVDDEGHVAERTVLVEDGILRSYLHDSASARFYGVPPTGNGRRESYRHAPMPRMTCTFVDDGPHSRDEIIASVDRGVLAETYTDGTVDIESGDFSFYVKNGWLIEGGRRTLPLRDFSLAGNGPEALRRVSMVGDDARFDPGGWTCGKRGQQVPVSQGMPTVLVSAMTISEPPPA